VRLGEVRLGEVRLGEVMDVVSDWVRLGCECG
jgi:hypothetical protein